MAEPMIKTNQYVDGRVIAPPSLGHIGDVRLSGILRDFRGMDMPTGCWGGVDHTACVGVIAGCHKGRKTHTVLR